LNEIGFQAESESLPDLESCVLTGEDLARATESPIQHIGAATSITAKGKVY
jgi:hypothetical protein